MKDDGGKTSALSASGADPSAKLAAGAPASRRVSPLYLRLAILLAAVLLPALIYSVFAAYSGYRESQARSQESVVRFGEVAASRAQLLIDSTRRLSTALAATDFSSVSNEGNVQCARRLGYLVNTFAEYTGFAIVGEDGRVVCSSSATAVGLSAADRPWFQQVKATRDVSISQLVVSKLDKTPVVVVAVPLGEAGAPFRGAMSAGISILWLAGLSEASSMPAESAAFLIDRAGSVVTRAGTLIEPGSLAATIGNTELDGLPGKDVLQSSILHGVREFAAKGSDGVERLYSLTNLSHSDIFFILGVPEAGSIGFARRDFASRMLAAMAMAFCALVGVAVGGDLLVARGLRALSAVAQAYRHGDYSARPDVKGGSLEVLQLSETLSRMAERVQRHEQDMSRAIQQKDAMLKEVHHRVKNNLQVVTSLMSIQANRLKDESSKLALAELQRRVRALGLLHRHLYEGDDLRYLDFGQFTAELCQMVKESSGLIARGISIEVDIPPIPITADRAVPLGLLITEALGNALKHAFPAGRKGTIRISLSASAEGIATISISDDGIGPPPAFADTATISPLGPGTGLLLMQAFAQQLGGELTVEGPPGTTVGFSFNLAESGPEASPHLARDGTGGAA